MSNFVEVHGWYDECSLNKKLLKIPLECFAEIFAEDIDYQGLVPDKINELLEKATGEERDSIIELVKDFSKESFKTFLMTASNLAITEVLKIVPFGTLGQLVFDSLVQTINK